MSAYVKLTPQVRHYANYSFYLRYSWVKATHKYTDSIKETN